jgi:hypothetical protein
MHLSEHKSCGTIVKPRFHEAGAPVNEIEVTPDMIEAGHDVIARQWSDFVGPLGFQLWDKVLREVFLAMSAKRL